MVKWYPSIRQETSVYLFCIYIFYTLHCFWLVYLFIIVLHFFRINHHCLSTCARERLFAGHFNSRIFSFCQTRVYEGTRQFYARSSVEKVPLKIGSAGGEGRGGLELLGNVPRMTFLILMFSLYGWMESATKGRMWVSLQRRIACERVVRTQASPLSNSFALLFFFRYSFAFLSTTRLG